MIHSQYSLSSITELLNRNKVADIILKLDNGIRYSHAFRIHRGMYDNVDISYGEIGMTTGKIWSRKTYEKKIDALVDDKAEDVIRYCIKSMEHHYNRVISEFNARVFQNIRN